MEVLEAKWTQAARDAYFKEHPENFAGPDGSYPIRDKSDVEDAWCLAGHGDNPDAIRTRIKSIAKRLKLADGLPDTAKDDDDKKEATSPATLREANSPRPRIATIQVCWIEDGAHSLNGRIYPAEAVDRLIATGQRKLADPEALPLTCFLSHDSADNDKTQDLIGRITRLWREGTRGMALIDLADTSVARDALALIAGGYLCTESLRAKNAEIRVDQHYDAPVVGGGKLELEGIDLTNYPGLEHVARIQQVQIAESTKSAIVDVFNISPQSVSLIKDGTMDEKDTTLSASTALQETHKPEQILTEAAGGNMPTYVPASGNTIGMTNDPPQDSYGQRMYKAPTMTSGPMQGMENPSTGVDLQEAHDRIAMVQARECAPGRESVRWAMAYLQMTEREQRSLTERGRALSAINDSHLDKAHDAIARHAKMACEGAKNKRHDPDNDGDDDSTNDPAKNPDQMESAKKASSPMTKDEALKLLEAQGYSVQIERKKTESELLQEQLAKQAQQIEELRSLVSQPSVQNEPNPQRKSMVLGANTGVSNGSIRDQLYYNGMYLQKQIREADWSRLADRTCPLPEGIDPLRLTEEFGRLLAYQYDQRYQVLSATEL